MKQFRKPPQKTRQIIYSWSRFLLVDLSGHGWRKVNVAYNASSRYEDDIFFLFLAINNDSSVGKYCCKATAKCRKRKHIMTHEVYTPTFDADRSYKSNLGAFYQQSMLSRSNVLSLLVYLSL